MNLEKKKILTDDEKMKNKFKFLRECVLVIEAIMIVVILGFIVTMPYLFTKKGIEDFNDPNNLNIEQNIEAKRRDYFGNMKDPFIEEVFKYESIGWQIFYTIKRFILITIVLIVVHCLGKMFNDISKEGRPFSEANNKRITIINVLSWILFFFGGSFISVGLVTVIALSAITAVYKYGYKLQIESDETL